MFYQLVRVSRQLWLEDVTSAEIPPLGGITTRFQYGYFFSCLVPKLEINSGPAFKNIIPRY